jgi:hypothetical protein
MQKSFRATVLAIGGVILASSLAFAQAPPTPAPDAGVPAPQHRKANKTKSKKQSGKKGARKKARKKTASH